MAQRYETVSCYIIQQTLLKYFKDRLYYKKIDLNIDLHGKLPSDWPDF